MKYRLFAVYLVSFHVDSLAVEVFAFGGQYVLDLAAEDVVLFVDLGLKEIGVELAARLFEHRKRIPTGIRIKGYGGVLVAVKAIDDQIESGRARQIEHIGASAEGQDSAEEKGGSHDDMSQHAFFCLDKRALAGRQVDEPGRNHRKRQKALPVIKTTHDAGHPSFPGK